MVNSILDQYKDHLSAICNIPSVCTWMVCMHCCCPTLHTLIIPSELPDRICVPSEDTTSALTFSEWPFSFMMRLQVRGSHIRSAFSVEPLTMIEPDGFIAKLYIESLEPAKFDAANGQQQQIIMIRHDYKDHCTCFRIQTTYLLPCCCSLSMPLTYSHPKGKWPYRNRH